MKFNKLIFFLFGSLVFAMTAHGQKAPLVVLTPENPFSKAPQIKVDPETLLNTLRPEHPRIWITKDRIASLKEQSKKDPVLAGYIKSVILQANARVNKAATGHRDLLNKEEALGLAYQFTGDKRYFESVQKDLLNLCAQKDWGWIHFLDPAESCVTVAIGYDWFYDCYSDSTRQYIRNRLINNGLIPGLASYAGAPFGWFTYVRHNWNQVCNSGLIIGALAIADTDPGYARAIIPKAVASLPLAINEYAPDGAYPEGTGYWGFGTSQNIQGMAALRTSLGTDFGLSGLKGFDQTYYFSLYTRGPSRIQMGYADQSPKETRSPDGLWFWMASRFNNFFLSDNEHAFLEESKKQPGPMHVVYYVPPTGKPLEDIPLDRFFNGPVPVATMRASWGDKNAAFAGIKGGYNQVNHGHLDLGNFEIDLLGQRWFYDIGSDNYELDGYFGMDGSRWNYYRTSSFSHNVPTFDGKNQDIQAKANMVQTSLNTNTPFVIVDLSDPYSKYCSRVNRGISLLNDRKFILVQDEYDVKDKHDLNWGVSTDADIQILGNKVHLVQGGKRITATIITPKNAVFKKADAPQLSTGEKPTNGIRRLSITLADVSGKQTIAVLISPDDAAVPSAFQTIKPMINWSTLSH